MADHRFRRFVTISGVLLLLSGFAGAYVWQGGRLPDDQVRMAARVVGSSHVAASAFVVAPGMVVTNAHVTMRCRAGNLPLSVAGEEGWQVVREDPASELALLSGPMAHPRPAVHLTAARQLPHGTPVMLMGYPLGGDGEPGELRMASGRVQRSGLTVHRPEIGTSVSFFTTGPDGQDVDPHWADGIAYFGERNAERLRWITEINASSSHGDSGGPVIDTAGNVVGVVFAGSPDKAETSAVTLDDLRTFLLSADITPLFAPPPRSQRVDWSRAIEIAAPSVVPVGC